MAPTNTVASTVGKVGSLPRMDLKPTTAKMLRTVTPLRIAGVLVDLFTRVGQRDPPTIEGSKKTSHHRFISIAVSNYVEKARWGLDLLEANPKSPLYYTEDLHPPAFAAFQTVPASKDQASQAPMVVLDDGRCIWGSEMILQELCSNPETINLYPKEIENEIKSLEADLGTRLGASARCFGYYCLLDKSKKHYEAASKFLTLHCPKIEQRIFDKLLYRGLAKGMIRAMKVEECGPTSQQEIRKVFDEMSQKLEANGGEYLMGKEYGFTAADLTLGALSYFLVRPPEMDPFLLHEADTPLQLLELGLDLRQTLAGKHVLRIYEEHRPVDTTTEQVAVKKVDQNRTPWKEIAGAATLMGAVAYGFSSWRS